MDKDQPGPNLIKQGLILRRVSEVTEQFLVSSIPNQNKTPMTLLRQTKLRKTGIETDDEEHPYHFAQTPQSHNHDASSSDRQPTPCKNQSNAPQIVFSFPDLYFFV